MLKFTSFITNSKKVHEKMESEMCSLVLNVQNMRCALKPLSLIIKSVYEINFYLEPSILNYKVIS